MTMFGFTLKCFQPSKGHQMDLFFVSALINGEWKSVAYWADSPKAASDQAILDGATSASAWPIPAYPDLAREYHGPDFAGRRLYKIDFISERGEFADETVHVAADTIKDAAGFADEFTNGRHRFICLIPPGTELDFVEPGWDQ